MNKFKGVVIETYRKKLIDALRVNFECVRVNVHQELHEDVIWHIIVVDNSLFFFSEVVRKGCLEVGGTGGENYLMTVDGLAFYHEGDITKLSLVEYAEEVLLVVRIALHACVWVLTHALHEDILILAICL